jgi:hypothetical protein
MRLRENDIDETVLPNLTAEDLKELGVASFVLGYEPAEALHCLCNTLLIGADNLAKVFGVHAGRQCR